MSDAAQIYVGCDPNGCDLEQMMVLEYSIRLHASIPFEIHWMRLSCDPNSFWYADPATGAGWRTQLWSTPFSGFRWAVPACCDFKGRAIYMDADMLVLCDIAALWRAPFAPGKVVMAKAQKRAWRFCLSLWDCAAAKEVLPPLETLRLPEAHARQSAFFRTHAHSVQTLDSGYNNIDGEGQPLERIRVLHYSDMGTQFSHKYALPRLQAEGRRHWFDGEIVAHPRADLQALFDQYYEGALAAGYSLERYRAPHFGPFVKASQTSYRGNRSTRRLTLKWRAALQLRLYRLLLQR